MHRMIALLASLLSISTWACTSPAVGTLEDMLTQATWTVESGSNWSTSRTATVRVALPALNVTGHSCLTWSAVLVLPQGVTLADDATAVRNGLAASAAATFPVVVESAAHDDEVRYERGWLRIQVRNPHDDPGVVLHRASGSPMWLFPVNFQFGDD